MASGRAADVMRAVHGQGWQTLAQIVARTGWTDAGPEHLAPLAWWLARRGWLVSSPDGRWWIHARLARFAGGRRRA